MTVAGVIIAGGRSSRMGGGEKIFAQVGDGNILGHIVDRMASQVGRLAINANGDAARFASTGLDVIADLPGDAETPLAGLRAALRWTAGNGFDSLITVPSDTPFLPRDLLARLAAAGQKAAIAASGGQDHYLTGLWAVSMNGALDNAIREAPMFRVKDWAKLAAAAKVEWPDRPFDPFFNVNTPDDLAEARRIAAEFGV